MADAVNIVPPTSSPRVKTVDLATAIDPRVMAGVEIIRNVKNRRLPSFLPYLIWEYGLTNIEQYLANPYVLLDEGRLWQIERDTHAAVERALGWLEYTADIVEAPKRRSWWNSFQLNLSSLPAVDDPDLEAIEAVTNLSTPYRSDFRRGVSGYDVGAIEADWSRLDYSLLDRESGVRLHDGGPLWSFGRVHEVDHLLTEAEGTAIGNWVDPGADGLTWDSAVVAWENASFPWETDGLVARKQIMALSFLNKSAHVVLRDSGGSVIGYRRAICIRACTQQSGGPYKFAGLPYMPSANPSTTIIEARTDFGNAAGRDVASLSLLINGELAEGIPPGRDWIEPEDISGGTEIAVAPVSFTARQTVREHIKFRLRF